MKVRRLIDNFVQVFVGPQVVAIVYSKLVLVSNLSFCRMYKSQVSEVPHVAQFSFVHDVSSANTLSYQKARSKI